MQHCRLTRASESKSEEVVVRRRAEATHIFVTAHRTARRSPTLQYKLAQKVVVAAVSAPEAQVAQESKALSSSRTRPSCLQLSPPIPQVQSAHLRHSSDQSPQRVDLTHTKRFCME